MQKVVSAGIPKTTVKGTSSDTAQSLSDLGASISNSSNAPVGGQVTRPCGFAIVSVETNAVRVGFGAASTTVGHLLQPGDSVLLEDVNEVNSALIISAVAGSHAAIQITTEY